MPETSVDKDRQPGGGEGNIGTHRQTIKADAKVLAKAQPAGMKTRAQSAFRSCINTAIGRHRPAHADA